MESRYTHAIKHQADINFYLQTHSYKKKGQRQQNIFKPLGKTVSLVRGEKWENFPSRSFLLFVVGFGMTSSISLRKH